MAVASNRYAHTAWVIFWGSGSLVESKWCHYVMVDADSLLKLLYCIHIRQIQCFWAHSYAVHGHMAVASNNYTHTTWVRFWGSGSLVESKWCHYIMVEADSPLKLLPPSTLDIYKVAHWYVVHGRKVAAFISYTHTTWIRFWGPRSLVESKWCHYVMVEADSTLKLLPASTLDI
jgi:hypothetical protein